MTDTNTDPVRVAVRVRPLSKREQVHGHVECVRTMPQHGQLVLGDDRAFTFDHVFPGYVSQERVYENAIKPLVEGCFEGYNATIFAYGQTGTGKTHTMSGAGVTGPQRGIIPRAMEALFARMEDMSAEWEFTVRVSYVEIYMERLTDLLAAEAPVGKGGVRGVGAVAGGFGAGARRGEGGGAGAAGNGLRIREDAAGNTVLTGAETPLVTGAQETLQLLTAGTLARRTSATGMNAQSSRSHSIFTVMMEQRRREEAPSIEGPNVRSAMFHLCDLAGSERQKQTGNTGGRLKESVHINSGLLALGNVVNALSRRGKANAAGATAVSKKHVPYRDSRLTRLLKDSLGGNSRTLMLACVSPSDDAFGETLNTLQYAARARHIDNRPIVNTDSHEAAIQEMLAEIETLREQLRSQQAEAEAEGVESGVTEAYTGALGALRQRNRRLRRALRVIAINAPGSAAAVMSWNELRDLVRPMRVGPFGLPDVGTSSSEEELPQNEPELPSGTEYEPLNSPITAITGSATMTLPSSRPGTAEMAARGAGAAAGAAESEMAVAELEVRLADTEAALVEARDRLEQDDVVLAQKLAEISHLTARNGELEAEKAAISAVSSAVEREQQQSQRSPPSLTQGREAQTTPSLAREYLQSAGAQVGAADFKSFNITGGSIASSVATATEDAILRNVRSRGQELAQHFEEEEDEVQFIAESSDEGEPLDEKQQQYEEHEKERGQEAVPSTVAKRVEMPDNMEALVREAATVAAVEGASEAMGYQLEQAENRARSAEAQMHELAFNIRMKQDLIKQLVRSEKDARTTNKSYEVQVAAMARDVAATKKELSALRAQIKERSGTPSEARLRKEYEAKLSAGRARIAALAKKQKDNEKMAKLQRTHAGRLRGLEGTVARMTKEQERLRDRLHVEAQDKAAMEKELLALRRQATQARQANNKLVSRTEAQETALARRGTELRDLQRRLRDAERGIPVWQDSAIEAEVERRLDAARLEAEEAERDRLQREREVANMARDSLQIEKMRRSQHISSGILRASQRLDSVMGQLRAREQSLEQAGTAAAAPETRARLLQEIEELRAAKAAHEAEIARLQSDTDEDRVLDASKEQRLVELTEHISVIDATLKYRNDSIARRRRRSLGGGPSTSGEADTGAGDRGREDELASRIRALSAEECRGIVLDYFARIVALRTAERQTAQRLRDAALEANEQTTALEDMRSALQHHELAADRRIIQLQHEHEEEVRFLLGQLQAAGGGGGNLEADTAVVDDLRAEIESLQRDLYYYKKSTRDLRRRVRVYEKEGRSRGTGGNGDSGNGDESFASVASAASSASMHPSTPSSSSGPASRARNRSRPPSARATAAAAAATVVEAAVSSEELVHAVKIPPPLTPQAQTEEIAADGGTTISMRSIDSTPTPTPTPTPRPSSSRVGNRPATAASASTLDGSDPHDAVERALFATGTFVAGDGMEEEDGFVNYDFGSPESERRMNVVSHASTDSLVAQNGVRNPWT